MMELVITLLAIAFFSWYFIFRNKADVNEALRDAAPYKLEAPSFDDSKTIKFEQKHTDLIKTDTVLPLNTSDVANVVPLKKPRKPKPKIESDTTSTSSTRKPRTKKSPPTTP